MMCEETIRSLHWGFASVFDEVLGVIYLPM
jgi:hypothetical protein